MQIGNPSDDADAADDCKGGGDDAVGGAGHHIAAARRHLVDRGGHFDLALAQPQDFGRSNS